MKLKIMCQKFWNQVKNFQTLNKTALFPKLNVIETMILEKSDPKEILLVCSESYHTVAVKRRKKCNLGNPQFGF